MTQTIDRNLIGKVHHSMICLRIPTILQNSPRCIRFNPLAYTGFMLILVLASSLLAAPLSAQNPINVQHILRDLGFTLADSERLLAGEIISGDLNGGSPNEIAISVTMLISVDHNKVYDAAREGRTIEVARDVIDFRDLGDQVPTKQAFASAGFSPDEAGEILMLARAEPGSKFNLSNAELKQFQEVGRRFGTLGAGQDPTVRKHINTTYQDILLDRCLNYQQNGIQSIAPYDRGTNEQIWPGRELATAEAQSNLSQYTPSFYQAFVSYPSKGNSDIEHRFYWIKQRIDDRPTFLLAHRMFQVKQSYAVMTERQFYVGHSYNTRQIIVGCLPVNQGTVVFYTNRLSTDRINVESVADILREVGQGHLREKVTEHFKDIRQFLQQENSGR